ncbi:PREDICTED: lipid phosphate phosphatase-related protein type 2 [Thamnophis sirtalis]|uniref:Lipid phosphate phosphatase-related protein type 2 n=1 Tax=Thamnophis sirtalis TaxID=35019 RepID=A0A6I9XQM6_9SAUR|nr:PREDICTED: lipid phosphate phosphatase-related protein type 2 [Thamnophis sirtalis]
MAHNKTDGTMMKKNRGLIKKQMAKGIGKAKREIVTCVVNNFQSPVSSAKKVSSPEKAPSVPVLGLPCVDSSLNKLSVAQVALYLRQNAFQWASSTSSMRLHGDLWDKKRTGSAISLSASSSLPPQILVGELAAFFFQPTRHKEKTIISGECCYFNPLLRRMIRFLGVYSFGLFTTTIFANAGQVVTGNQTPHFLSVCQPNYTVLGCQPPPGTIYVTDKSACTGNPLLVTAACKAFPSKDAALSAYAVAYTVV